MKKSIFLFAVVLVTGIPTASYAAQGVAIQRVITNTRAELGQLADSGKAKEIARLMKKFDEQYETWNTSCGMGEAFDPAGASDACKEMASQMRETGISLYGQLSDYLPDVAARYEQGARSAQRILEANALDKSPAALYQASMDGISEAPRLGAANPGDAGTPFDLEIADFPDPTDEMFAVLEKLVPDFGKEIPESVRAGNAQITMAKKARRARYLAEQFKKAKLVLESQRDYGEIVFNVTKAVTAMPQVLGIQYTGTRFTARPNQKVLEYYRSSNTRGMGSAHDEPSMGGFEPRS